MRFLIDVSLAPSSETGDYVRERARFIIARTFVYFILAYLTKNPSEICRFLGFFLKFWKNRSLGRKTKKKKGRKTEKKSGKTGLSARKRRLFGALFYRRNAPIRGKNVKDGKERSATASRARRRGDRTRREAFFRRFARRARRRLGALFSEASRGSGRKNRRRDRVCRR